MIGGGPGLLPGLTRRLAAQGGAVLVAALGHLLAQNDWARARLAGHAGRRIRIGIEPVSAVSDPSGAGAVSAPPIVLAITPDGLLEAAAGDTPAPAVAMLLRLSPAALADLVRDGAAGLARHLRIEGEAALAADLGELARHLRWDVAEDLSRFTGDIAAQRIVGAVAGAGAAVRDAGGRVQSQLAQYLTAESGRLVHRDGLAQLADQLDVLERRIDALSAVLRKA